MAQHAHPSAVDAPADPCPLDLEELRARLAVALDARCDGATLRRGRAWLRVSSVGATLLLEAPPEPPLELSATSSYREVVHRADLALFRADHALGAPWDAARLSRFGELLSDFPEAMPVPVGPYTLRLGALSIEVCASELRLRCSAPLDSNASDLRRLILAVAQLQTKPAAPARRRRP